MSLPTFETLYKKAKKKGILMWSIRIEPSVKTEGSYTIISENGIKGGSMVRHETEIDKGKVKRTILEQTIQTVQKKWSDKLHKELYSTQIDESVSNTEESDENSIKSQKSEKSEKSEKKTAIFRPMLAKTFNFALYEKKGRSFKIEFPAYVQIKYDGLRCASYLNAENRIVMESRKGIPFVKFDAISKEIAQLVSTQPTVHIDGELFTDGMTFEELSGLIRNKNEEFNQEDMERIAKVEYHIYDFYDTTQPQLTYQQRMQWLNQLFDQNPDLQKCKNVSTYSVANLQQVKEMHDRFVEEGHEGVMIRDPRGTYEVNHRSKYLQKYKEFDEEEFEIVGYHEGTGSDKGLVIWDCITKDGVKFAVRPKGSFELRRKWYNEADSIVGKRITVKYQGFCEEGSPRFPVGKAIRELY